MTGKKIGESQVMFAPAKRKRSRVAVFDKKNIRHLGMSARSCERQCRKKKKTLFVLLDFHLSSGADIFFFFHLGEKYEQTGLREALLVWKNAP